MIAKLHGYLFSMSEEDSRNHRELAFLNPQFYEMHACYVIIEYCSKDISSSISLNNPIDGY